MEMLPHHWPATEDKHGRSSGTEKAITRQPRRNPLTPSDCNPTGDGKREKDKNSFLSGKELAGKMLSSKLHCWSRKNVHFSYPSRGQPQSREDKLDANKFHSPEEGRGQTGGLLLPFCHSVSVTVLIYPTNIECLLCIGSL